MDPQTAVIELREHFSEVQIAEAVHTHQTTVNRIYRGKQKKIEWSMGNALIELANKQRKRRNGAK